VTVARKDTRAGPMACRGKSSDPRGGLRVAGGQCQADRVLLAHRWDILERQDRQGWGAPVVDLHRGFPGTRVIPLGGRLNWGQKIELLAKFKKPTRASTVLK
jgi:hypothetical protein